MKLIKWFRDLFKKEISLIYGKDYIIDQNRIALQFTPKADSRIKIITLEGEILEVKLIKK